MQIEFDFDAATYQSPRDHIQIEFEDYHKKHPNIRVLIERTMMQRKQQGYNRVGLWLFFQQLMASPSWSMAKPGSFKHDYMSRYARLIMKENAELEGFFEIRPLKCEAGSVEVRPGRRGVRHVRS